MDVSKYTEIFIEESREYLQKLNQNMLELEKNSQEASLINEIFRITHTLKGMAGTMGYNKMTKFTHGMEDTLHLIRTGEKMISSETLEVLFKCLDALEQYVNSIVNFGNEGEENYQDLIKLLAKVSQKELPIEGNYGDTSGRSESKHSNEDIQNSKPQQNAELYKTDEKLKHSYPVMELDKYDLNVIEMAKSRKINIYRVDISIDKRCLLKSARAFIFFQTMEKHGEVIKSKPPVPDIEKEKFDFDISVLIITKSDKNDIKTDLSALAEVEHFQIEEIILPNEKTPQLSESSQANKLKHGRTVRVDIERLDLLMNLVSELVIIKNSISRVELAGKSPILSESIESLERVATSLHDAVTKARMVPIETVFNRFPRMIRDIAREHMKEINLEMTGEETELDRTVIDEIGEPLIHLLRNSVGHGIESVAQRIEKGKSEQGHIFLRAYPDGSNVVIEVEDDGQGINIEKARNLAVSKGLISIDVARNLSPEEVVNFLFLPGFSTSESLTDLSGRGVGLDVVKTKIESMGGHVEVASKMTEGTKFTVRLPLTLAIINALLVWVGEEEYAIPISSIMEIINILPEEVKYVQNKEVILHRDSILPIVRLEKFFKVETDDSKVRKTHTVVVVKKADKQGSWFGGSFNSLQTLETVTLRSKETLRTSSKSLHFQRPVGESDKFLGIVVNGIIGQREIVIKTLGRFLSKLKVISGATILEDGKVALILDVNFLQ